MRAELYWISAAPQGRLAIMPRPRGGDWLADELKSWQTAGVDVIVSLLRHEEITDLKLDHEPTLCEQLGIQFISFPISDRGVPDSAEQYLQLITQLEGKLRNGQGVGIHCRMGIGRSALLAASLLVRAGHTVADAFSTIANDRGMLVPDTDAQVAWMDSFARDPRGLCG